MSRISFTFARVCGGAIAVALVSIALSGTGVASAAKHAADQILGHPVSGTPRAGGILTLGHDHKFPASAIPTVAAARKATTATSATSARSVGGQSISQLTGSCPSGTADLGTWCMMVNPYPIAAAQTGQNNYFWASQACVAIGGFLPDAAQLIGAAKQVKLESTIDDNPSTSTVEGSDGNGPELDQREMSATLVTVQAGSDAAGSEGVTPGAHPDPSTGQPDPTPQPAVPSPSTLQYVTVYSNHTQGGFAGSEPVGTPENFRCAFYLKQSESSSPSTHTSGTATKKSKPAPTASVMRDRALILHRSLVVARGDRAPVTARP